MMKGRKNSRLGSSMRSASISSNNPILPSTNSSVLPVAKLYSESAKLNSVSFSFGNSTGNKELTFECEFFVGGVQVQFATQRTDREQKHEKFEDGVGRGHRGGIDTCFEFLLQIVVVSGEGVQVCEV